MDNRDDVRDFLATRGVRITPQEAGVNVHGANRRVPGLRRQLSTGTWRWKGPGDGDVVVAQVRTAENEGERELFGVRRARTHHIPIRRAWRGRGVTETVIADSVRQLGYEQATLGLNSENPNRAFARYKSLGYEVVARNAVYHEVV